MIDPSKTQGFLPSDKQSIIPSELDIQSDGGQDLSDSPWAKMFPTGATKEELNMFVQTFLKSLITQMKHDEKMHKENLAKQKAAMEG